MLHCEKDAWHIVRLNAERLRHTDGRDSVDTLMGDRLRLGESLVEAIGLLQLLQSLLVESHPEKGGNLAAYLEKTPFNLFKLVKHRQDDWSLQVQSRRDLFLVNHSVEGLIIQLWNFFEVNSPVLVPRVVGRQLILVLELFNDLFSVFKLVSLELSPLPFL